MISYQPFYATLYRKGITEYALIFKYGIPSNTLHRMKHGGAVTTKTLDTLCEILECPISDILEYIPPEEIWAGQLPCIGNMSCSIMPSPVFQRTSKYPHSLCLENPPSIYQFSLWTFHFQDISTDGVFQPPHTYVKVWLLFLNIFCPFYSFLLLFFYGKMPVRLAIPVSYVT